MLTDCHLSQKARTALHDVLGVPAAEDIVGVQLEFKEMPYFLVSRSIENWKPEVRGDINMVMLQSITERGVIVDPMPGGEQSMKKLTLIPWSNVISLTVSYGTAGRTEQA